jgi:hypothetical protein
MSDQELAERLDLMEKRIHERFDHIHRRHKRIEGYLFAVIVLIVVHFTVISW